MEQEVQKVLHDIRSRIQADGGDLELVSVEKAKGEVTVKLHGACVGCPMSSITLKAGVEHALKAKLPWVRLVKAV